MSDFGLDDDIIKEKILLKTLKWHGFLLDDNTAPRYNTMSDRAGKPTDNKISIKGGMVSDLEGSSIKSSGDNSHE